MLKSHSRLCWYKSQLSKTTAPTPSVENTIACCGNDMRNLLLDQTIIFEKKKKEKKTPRTVLLSSLINKSFRPTLQIQSIICNKFEIQSFDK